MDCLFVSMRNPSPQTDGDAMLQYYRLSIGRDKHHFLTFFGAITNEDHNRWPKMQAIYAISRDYAVGYICLSYLFCHDKLDNPDSYHRTSHTR